MTEPDDKKRDNNFLMRGIIYALLIMGVFYAFEPYMGKSATPPDNNAVSKLASDVIVITPQTIEKHLQTSKKPTVLVVYASWCNYCKKTMPAIKSLWDEKKFAGKEVIFASIDTNLTAFATYLLSHDLAPMIGQPVVVKTNVSPGLPELLQKRGSTFRGGVPYIGFYNADGQMVSELTGLAYKSSIEDALGALDR